MTMDKNRHSTCFYFCLVVLINWSQGQPSQHLTANTILPAVKKDVFMSRGWGASGMPFTMFYLNHYAKAQKAYAQNQQQLYKNQQQQDIEERKLRLGAEEPALIDQPRILPYGTRYAEPVANAQHSEYGRSSGIKEDEYSDGGVYLPSKPNTPRRPYNVPQLFVSYGWGPMG
ncbi:uncharacterized protein LOC129727062 [Wyeomyia smithii]|uniref:uncharacterized protein LOC129727062 n=1 Tax=Wyeomyia smithii TaxID=174621 RepID=UPI00246801BC|nr:uncharacterized protein LOC129727062 [Wyeomyia smithii]